MRVFLLATMLLASTSVCAFAQEPGKAPEAVPPAGTSAQTDHHPSPPQDQKAGREQQKTDGETIADGKMRRSDGDRMGRDDRDTGHGGMMRRGDGDRMGRDDRDTGHGGMMRRSDGDRMGYDRDKDRGRYHERGERYWDDADRDRTYRGYADADRPRRRVKICVEYDNGEEYCRYRQ